MICMIPQVNLGVWRNVIYVLLFINSMNLPCLTFVLLGDTSDSLYSSFFITFIMACCSLYFAAF